MQKFSRSIAGKFLPVLLLVLLGACVTPASSTDTPLVYNPRPTQRAVLIGVPPDATVTPTAFQPIPPTQTNTPLPPPTNTPLPTATITYLNLNPDDPTIWTGIGEENLPPPAPPLVEPENQFTLLLLGTDQRPGEHHFRTDVIILVVVNLDNKTISLIHFPRDLFVYSPGWTMERINSTFIRGGWELTQTMLEYNFGFKPDHYALVHFEGFKEVIDTLGGIEVVAGKELSDHRTGYGTVTIFPGQNHMDGETALWYVRARYTASDFERGIREQEVLIALFRRLLTLDVVAKAPQLYNIFQDSIETDLSRDAIFSLIPLVPDFYTADQIHTYLINRDYVQSWRHPYTYAQVLLPKRESIQVLLRQALNITP